MWPCAAENTTVNLLAMFNCDEPLLTAELLMSGLRKNPTFLEFGSFGTSKVRSEDETDKILRNYECPFWAKFSRPD